MSSCVSFGQRRGRSAFGAGFPPLRAAEINRYVEADKRLPIYFAAEKERIFARAPVAQAQEQGSVIVTCQRVLRRVFHARPQMPASEMRGSIVVKMGRVVLKRKNQTAADSLARPATGNLPERR